MPPRHACEFLATTGTSGLPSTPPSTDSWATLMEIDTDRVRLFEVEPSEVEALRFCGHGTIGGAMFAARLSEGRWYEGYRCYNDLFTGTTAAYKVVS
jgi:hypothetical protein